MKMVKFVFLLVCPIVGATTWHEVCVTEPDGRGAIYIGLSDTFPIECLGAVLKRKQVNLRIKPVSFLPTHYSLTSIPVGHTIKDIKGNKGKREEKASNKFFWLSGSGITYKTKKALEASLLAFDGVRKDDDYYYIERWERKTTAQIFTKQGDILKLPRSKAAAPPQATTPLPTSKATIDKESLLMTIVTSVSLFYWFHTRGEEDPTPQKFQKKPKKGNSQKIT